AVGAELAFRRGREVDAPRELALEALRMDGEVRAEVEVDVEMHRQRGFRACGLARLADYHHVLAELGNPVALDLEVAALGVQRAGEEETLAVEPGLAVPASDKAHVRPLEHREVLRLPDHIRGFSRQAQRQGAARGEA